MLLIAVDAAIDAGKEILEVYKGDYKITYKADNSPLTVADKQANSIINSYLESTSIPIISEENEIEDYQIRKNWEKCWIVDPLDGTKEFINKNGEFTVNIALLNNNKPVLGVIYVPVTKELYVGNVFEKKAIKLIVKDNFNSQNIFDIGHQIYPKKTNTSTIKIVSSRSHMNNETITYINSFNDKKVDVLAKGSSLKFCIIAEGKADIYPRFAPTMEWDTAAGHAICSAVGVRVISILTNKELYYNKENILNSSFIVKL